MSREVATTLAVLLAAVAVVTWPQRARPGGRRGVRDLRDGRRARPGGRGLPGLPDGRSGRRWPGRVGPQASGRGRAARPRRDPAAGGPSPLGGVAPGPLQPAELPATVLLELAAAALLAGLPGPQAVEAAATACGPQVRRRVAAQLDAWRLGVPADRAWQGVDPELEPLARSLVMAERTGASAAVVLSAAAADARAGRRRRAVIAARRLGVLLVLPLGLTTLPAFVLVGVVPVVLGLAGQLLEAG